MQTPDARTDEVSLPVEVAALVRSIEHNGGVTAGELHDLLITLGLAKLVAYDPKRHGEIESLKAGAPYLEWAPGFAKTLEVGRVRLDAMFRRGLN